MKYVRSLVALFLLLIVTPLFSLTLEKGKIKLVLHESLGRYSLYYLEDVTRKRYEPLFLAEDPRTSFVDVAINNSVITLGDLSGFDLETKETAKGAQFVWTSKKLMITQDFEFIRSLSSSLPDGIKMSITLKNNSESTFETGVRILWDTMLGEEDDHFLVKSMDRQVAVNREFHVDRNNMPFAWISGSTDTTAFMTMLSGNVTLPQDVYFANWKRIEDVTWDYSYKEGRSFNKLPYYFNDSAAVHYYAKETLSTGESRTVTTAFGYASEGGFTLEEDSPELTGEKKDLANLYERTVNSDDTTGVGDTILETDLLTLKDLVSQIDYYLANEGELSDANLRSMQEIYSQIQRHKREIDQ